MDQQELIASLFYWPRVESYPATTVRYDQALMMSALAEGCVSFQVEWTYDEGVGAATDSNRNLFDGYDYHEHDVRGAQPWWGGSWRPVSGLNSGLLVGMNQISVTTPSVM